MSTTEDEPNAFERLLAACRRGDGVQLEVAEGLLRELKGTPEYDALADAVAEGRRAAWDLSRGR